MKRIKQPQNKDYSIDCTCGETFRARSTDGVLITNNENITVRRWTCPRCGQCFDEIPNQPIILDTIVE